LENSWFAEIQRISQPDYIPTESDVLRIPDGRPGVREYLFVWGSTNIRVVDCEVEQDKLPKILHQFGDVISIIFVVDLSSYNKINPVSATDSMTEALQLFDRVVNSQWFIRSSIILFLNNAGRFKEKLPECPLCNYFPDFSGGNDPSSAVEYIISRFRYLSPVDRFVYPHPTESTDPPNLRIMISAIREISIQNDLREANLI
jgi:guanine nucleotide-binding protein G(i) subunit alpha